MRLAYLDCFAGISGDMFLGALLDAGLDPRILDDAVAALDLGASLQIEKVDRCGITSTKVHVLEHGRLAEAHPHEPHDHQHPHEPDRHKLADGPDHQNTHQLHPHPKTQHFHKTGHEHDSEHAHKPHEPHVHPDHRHEHDHPHTHGRSLTAIRDLLRASALADPVKNFSIRAFELLGHSEAKIHNVPVEEIHFHEVGAVDAIVDITCAAAGIHALNQQAVADTGEPLRWHSSPLNVGGGTVHCAHGNFPVPAPATADLLRGLPTYSAHIENELVTPTGAALIRALDPDFGPQPAMLVDHIGYGAGTRNPTGFPNVLRLSIGDFAEAGPTATPPHAASVATTTLASLTSTALTDGATGSRTDLPQHHPAQSDTVTVLETALDDLSPQILAHVTETALALGALDVMSTAVIMKKGRLGTLLTILTDDIHSAALERLLLRETSTLGIRIRTDRRICLAREHHTVQTAFGPIRIKIGSFDSQELNAAPEFEDCRAAAAQHNAPLKQVMQAAIAAWLATKSE